MKDYENKIGVAVAIPNTIEEKMKAIVNLSEAIEAINVEVKISDCMISGVETGINIDPTDKPKVKQSWK